MKSKVPFHILPIIVFAQFAGTSLWFAGNAVIDSLIAELNFPIIFLGYITTAVQAGFIFGTLIFAFLNIADRFSPVKVFLVCAIGGSLLNLSIIGLNSALNILLARFATGFFLAGIYPVGMKIASDWHHKGLGKALGYLVGALVLGTAFPHLLNFIGADYPWRFVFIGTSALSLFGGLLLYFTVKDGPFKKQSQRLKFDYKIIFRLFKGNFKSAAFGYFGHMWELYTCWAFIPIILSFYLNNHPEIKLSVALWSFIIIGVGAMSCPIGGHLSAYFSSKWVSVISLFVSLIVCLFLPFIFELPLFLFLIILLVWGFFVIPDSPQFSTLVAKSSEKDFVGTGLTIVNSIGFALTIISIQLLSYLWNMTFSPMVFIIIAIGPLLGLFYAFKFKT